MVKTKKQKSTAQHLPKKSTALSSSLLGEKHFSPLNSKYLKHKP
jgi:hypothetical protein